MKNKWTKKFPKKVGIYWFYGFKFKPLFHNDDEKKKFYFLKVRKVVNGFINIIDGHGIEEDEIGEGLFCKAKYPEPPKGK